jgi:hypothetical protein
MNKSLFVIVISLFIVVPIRLLIGLLINGGKTTQLPFIIGVFICLAIYMLIKPYVEKLYNRLYPNG